MVYHHEWHEPPIVESEAELYNPDKKLSFDGNKIPHVFPVFGQAEDLFLPIFREAFVPMGITVLDQHAKDIDTPLILVNSSRATGAQGMISRDSRFMRSIRLSVSAIMLGPNAVQDCGRLLEACQHVLMNAWWEQKVVKGVGVISKISNFSEPSRVTDFQSSTNIVQYASLPKGHVRFEQNYNILLRPDSGNHENPFIQ